MQDGLGREIDYLRISVTDKCNLRCRYCMPPQGITPLAHAEILTLEEIFRLVGIMEQLGIRKVRLTGGEPMVRKNLPWLVEQIHGLPGIREIAMTTNGTLFAPQAEIYREAGLTAVNISMDTLDPERFRCITGCDRADRAAGVDSVLRAIDAALEQQLRVKINCVPCVEMNGEDMEGIAALAADRPGAVHRADAHRLWKRLYGNFLEGDFKSAGEKIWSSNSSSGEIAAGSGGACSRSLRKNRRPGRILSVSGIFRQDRIHQSDFPQVLQRM